MMIVCLDCHVAYDEVDIEWHGVNMKPVCIFCIERNFWTKDDD
jgi:hypothetical protein